MAMMSDAEKQSFNEDCRDFARKLYRMNKHMRYTEITSRVMKALSWIYVPIAAAYLALCVIQQEVSFLLLGLLFGIVIIQFVISSGLGLAYKYMLKECTELDRCANVIRDQVVLHPEWQHERIEIIIE
jgi:hypothetical protein